MISWVAEMFRPYCTPQQESISPDNAATTLHIFVMLHTRTPPIQTRNPEFPKQKDFEKRMPTRNGHVT